MKRSPFTRTFWRVNLLDCNELTLLFCHLHNACTTKFSEIAKRTRFFALPVVQILQVGCAKELPEDKGKKF